MRYATVGTVIVVLILAQSALSSEPTKGAVDKGQKGANAAKQPAGASKSTEALRLSTRAAREVPQKIEQSKGAARRRDREERESASARLPERPARSVTQPQLDSAGLDRLIADHLASHAPKVEPAPNTTDAEFLRRTHLDLAGVPPTPSQVLAFLADRSPKKRTRVVDQLLASEAFARNWARYWRDVIRFHATNQNPLQVRYDTLEDWLAGQFQAGKPWDEVARNLITASGQNDENGAAGFILAHEAKPVELAGEVSRIFMGVQIQCAQCHDHKTDSWKRSQFHEFAAFFSGIRAKPVVRAMPGQLPVFAVATQGRPVYGMPDKDDPKQSTPVAPRFFLASATTEARIPLNLGANARRTLAADYVTGQDNPWFARSFVNRVWYVLMGEGFYEPIDDIGPERTAKAAEIIEPLADQWQKGGYDIRWLFRTIMGTAAYQRRVRPISSPAGKTTLASICPSRLRSDQILDALIGALGLPESLVTARGREDRKGLGKEAGGAKSSGSKLAQAAGLSGAPGPAKGQARIVRLGGGPRILFNAVFGVDPSIPNEEVLGTIPQALFLMNGPIVNNRIQARPGTILFEILETTPSDRAALDALYLRVLSRLPNRREVEIAARHLESVGKRAEAFEDIYWCLINSTEFISRH